MKVCGASCGRMALHKEGYDDEKDAGESSVDMSTLILTASQNEPIAS